MAVVNNIQLMNGHEKKIDNMAKQTMEGISF